MAATRIRLLLADVDGTLVTPDKTLTARAVAAVRRLDEVGILFAITSGRPPRGMAMLVEPLNLRTPIAAFNGGLLVNPDMSVIEQRRVPEALVQPVRTLLRSFGLDVWIYRGVEWLVSDPRAPHVEREAWTVQFEPTVQPDLDAVTGDVVKIVGVSDDPTAMEKATAAARERFAGEVSAARSQPYYLDVTNREANKGAVAEYLLARYHLQREELATIGDMANDVLMFAHSGLSIAMGNADTEVQRAAKLVTASNTEEGFARAVERFLLGERDTDAGRGADPEPDEPQSVR